MKIIAVRFNFALLSAAVPASRSARADAPSYTHTPTRDTGRVVAYGADTVFKLGCWG